MDSNAFCGGLKEPAGWLRKGRIGWLCGSVLVEPEVLASTFSSPAKALAQTFLCSEELLRNTDLSTAGPRIVIKAYKKTASKPGSSTDLPTAPALAEGKWLRSLQHSDAN